MRWDGRDESANVIDARPGQTPLADALPLAIGGAAAAPLAASLARGSLGNSLMGAGGGLGFGLGNVLGLMSDGVGDIRRQSWRALGLPDTGAELAHNLLGVDRDGLAASVLGGGAEMLLDPVNLLSAGAGGLLAKTLAKFAPGVARGLSAANAVGGIAAALPAPGKIAQSFSRAQPMTPSAAYSVDSNPLIDRLRSMTTSGPPNY